MALCAFWWKGRNCKKTHYFLQLESSIAGELGGFPQVGGERPRAILIVQEIILGDT